MTDLTQILFSFPVVRSKKVTCAFDGGAITSNAGVLLLAQAERRLGIVDRIAALIPDGRDPSRVLHSVSDIFRAPVLAIACGHEDADNLDALRHDPAFQVVRAQPRWRLAKPPESRSGWPASQRCRGGNMHRTCARGSAWGVRWWISTVPATTLRPRR